MAIYTYPKPDIIHGENLAREIEAALGLAPMSVSVGVDDTLVFVEVPDTVATEAVAPVVAAHTGQMTVDQQDGMRLSNSGLGMSLADYRAVRTQMQVLRDLRQMGRNTFMAQAAQDRDRQMYDAFVAVTQVFLSILRDE